MGVEKTQRPKTMAIDQNETGKDLLEFCMGEAGASSQHSDRPRSNRMSLTQSAAADK